jgi:O-antigen ligase
VNAFFEKKLYLFLFSIILVFGSVFGNNETPVKQIFTEFNFFETLDLLATKESFFRTPDTFLRSSVFFLSIITMLLSFILKSSNTNILSTTLRNLITILPLVFFLTILSTDDFYNVIALLLVILSIYYTIFYAKRSFHRHESILISSYVLILIYPFYSSLIHQSSLAEIDNYLRFLFVIPVYITLRDMNISLKFFLLSIGLASLLSGALAIFQYLYINGPVAGYSSSSSVFGAIVLFFSLISIMSTAYFDKNKFIQYFLYVSSSIGIMGWMLTGQRGLILLIIFFGFFLFFTKSKSLLWTSKMPLFIIPSILILFFFTTPLFSRITNAYESTYNYVIEDSPHHWRHRDSIVPRLTIWEGSINIIKENGFHGIGLDNFNKKLEEQMFLGKIDSIRDSVNNKSAGMNHAHNQYLDIYVKTGILGLITLLIFLYIHIKYFRNGLNSDKSEYNLISLIGILSVFNFSIVMLFQTFLAHQQLILFMCLMLVTIGAMKSNLNHRRNKI